ncbi:hypothetical protein [Novosphingobium sp. B1]|uniref:hypothetical protein n=1 Tax=Novosphingobium sp. B1 TaxID=1938756 RepID=UPI0009D8ADF7|nr:hypothetical protein [Novosphingobium sp. B1]SMC74262.1 hypothetical protein SAMN06272759_106215 [Novosphingobium sp. B1]
MMHRALPTAVALAIAAAQLGGCVAAAIIPIAAGSTVAGKTALDGPGARSRSKTSQRPVVTVGTGPSLPVAAQPANEELRQEPVPAEQTAIAPAMADAVPPGDAYGAMAAYVLSRSADPKQAGARRSALLDQASLSGVPEMAKCTGGRSALVLDLDPGNRPFDLNDPPSPVAGLAERLRGIRATGTAIVWLASVPEGSRKDLSTILKATGLDPLGIDGYLLFKRNETRKQQLLNRAGQEWCVIAIAGDRKSDFDEVFDYLRNPDGPVAIALEQNLGAGLFLVPPPVQ